MTYFLFTQRGADVDQQSGRMKNTALHEAAALGPAGLQSAQVLLSCKAGVRRRNAGGQTAYDVAVNSGCNDTVSLLAARTGRDLLGKLGKHKLNLQVL
ncbi:double zinc ribbon and ankyrin repeat-containing protein 1-like [Cottoperca gobio]|uniref:Double zinc ribbon and ankyrin repeat-containing protein 1-like n=1 Tax=Cottoperca gobio TaxID=56716 RepID=A0A6J2PEY1_COTGO|nr:double zinc ribbon and ankyrin repeat-containing protein 1-like [Cottoperca gobio]